MKTQSLLLTAALLWVPSALSAAVITESYTFNVGSTAGDIPDGGSTLFSQLVSASQIVQLTEVQVSLNLKGNSATPGWAGDMFVSLNRGLGTQTAVLLNQVGVTGSNPAGSSFGGWNVVFKDSAANGDVHWGLPTAPASTLTGDWQPDGRLSPSGSSRTALLDVFNSSAANSTWYLHVADLSPGGSMTLDSWTLSFTGVTGAAVPEAQHFAAIVSASLLGFALLRRSGRS
ncbi:MAG: hypothetical protein WCP53_14080 [Verrucomicrobiota bacterium]